VHFGAFPWESEIDCLGFAVFSVSEGSVIVLHFTIDGESVLVGIVNKEIEVWAVFDLARHIFSKILLNELLN